MKNKLIKYILFTAIYVFLCFYIIHVTLAMQVHALELGEAMYIGITTILSSPLNVIPIPQTALLIIFLGTLLIGFTIFKVKTDLRVQRHDDPSTIHGKGKLLKGDELIEFQKKYSAPFGSVDHDDPYNMIISQDLYMYMENKTVDRNMNVFLIGGAGSGKSFRFVIPNILQANSSLLINDPSGGLSTEYGSYLEGEGYQVKIFNLSHMDRGNHYNPFKYIHSDKDVQILVNTLITNTTPPEQKSGDPFWEKSETLLLCAIISFLHWFTPEEDHNFSRVMDILRNGAVSEDSSAGPNPLDKLFEKRISNKECFAYKQYKAFKLAAAKTIQGVLISVAARLQAFDLNDIRELTSSDDIDLDRVGDEKTAIFVILPTGDNTFNFLASMMYSQLFQRLYDYCENEAEFTQTLVDGDGEIVLSARAKNQKESDEARDKLLSLLSKAKDEKISIERNEKTNLYEIKLYDGTLLGFRGDREKARKAANAIKDGSVIQNNNRSNGGKRLPIHFRMILDEFANTGRIPDFQEKVATIRKYEISVNIILQSLQQMKNLYKDEWEAISGNCDTTIYLGGGADTGTGEWFSKLMGKETKRASQLSFNDNGGGSMSISSQGVEMYTIADARLMKEDECLVIIRAKYPYIGKKYNTLKHPKWNDAISLPAYRFVAKRTSYLKDRRDELLSLVGHISSEPAKAAPESKDLIEQVNQMEKARAEEAANGGNALEAIISSPAVPDQENDTPIRELGIDQEQAESSEFLETNDDMFDDNFSFKAV